MKKTKSKNTVRKGSRSKTKKQNEKAKLREQRIKKKCGLDKRDFKCSDRTLLLSLPKLPVRAKYDEEYFKSWDVKYNKGKGSRFEKPSIRDEPFELPPRTVNLCRPRPDRVVKKYKKPRRKISNVRKSALTATPSERVVSLSGPMMRRLLVVRRDYGPIVEKDKLENIESLIQANSKKITQAMKEVFEPRKKPKRWTNEDWETHTPHILKISRPKRVFTPPDTRIKAYRSLYLLIPRLKNLSRPKSKYEKPPVIRWGHPKPSALTYEMSDRMTKIALHVNKGTQEKEKPYEYSKVSPNALRYIASERIKAMAQAKSKTKAPDVDFKENAFQVSPNALKYRPSKRILEMSQPKGS